MGSNGGLFVGDLLESFCQYRFPRTVSVPSLILSASPLNIGPLSGQKKVKNS